MHIRSAKFLVGARKVNLEYEKDPIEEEKTMSEGREKRAKDRSTWTRIKDEFVRTPSWCSEDSCYFYKTDECNSCSQCTFCGADLGPFGGNKDRAHAFRVESHGGRTWVPSCPSCSDSQGTSGFVEWLVYLKLYIPDKFSEIVSHQSELTYPDERRKRIRDKVLDVEAHTRASIT